MSAGYKTVNLRPETYERLRMYQFGAESLDRAIKRLMDLSEPEVLYRRELEIHRKRLAEMRSGKYLTLEELDRRLAKRTRGPHIQGPPPRKPKKRRHDRPMDGRVRRQGPSAR